MDTTPQPVDPKLAQRVSKLYQEVDEILAELRVPADEKKEIEENLMSAVAADLLTRLSGKLSEEQRTELAALGAGGEPDLKQVAEFFRTIFSQEELVNEVAKATESVLKDFISEMSR